MHVRSGGVGCLCTLLVLGVLAPAAWSAPIVPGQMLLPAPGQPDPTGGAVVASTGPVPFASPTLNGTLTTTVIQDPANPLGGLTFTYLLQNSPNSGDAIGSMTVNQFTGWATDASFQPGPGTVPTLINRSANGDVMGFDFLGSQLLPGATATLLVIETNAPAFTQNHASVIDSSVTQVTSFSPAPEPVTLSLLAIGGLLLARRRAA